MREYAFINPNRPSKRYGGIERVGIAHANEFARNGMRVHLFAHRYTDPYEYDKSIILHKMPKNDDQAVVFTAETVAKLHEQGHISVAIQEWERHDLTTALLTTEVPVVSTLQCYTYDTLLIKKPQRERVVYTALTEAHKDYLQRRVPQAKDIEVIGSGVDIARVPFSFQRLTESKEKPRMPILEYLKDKGFDYVTSLAAIGSHKGIRSAVMIAQAAKLPIILMGAPGEANSQSFRDELGYFAYYINPIEEHALAYRTPQLSWESSLRHSIIPQSPGWEIRFRESTLNRSIDTPLVYYLGPVTDTQKYEILRYATANLSCINLEDPSYFEALGNNRMEGPVTGTPTVSYADPSWKEIVQEGITGFTYHTSDEAVQRVRTIHEQGFNRQRCAMVAGERYSMSHAAVNLAHAAHRAIEKSQLIEL